MRRCTDQACWKCGQRVRHNRSWLRDFVQRTCALALAYPRIAVSERPGRPAKLIAIRQRGPMVAARHFVEKNGHFEVCKGSGVPN